MKKLREREVQGVITVFSLNMSGLTKMLILYVPLIPTCEPLLNFFWTRPCQLPGFGTG